jgi:ABC-type multidrug transport system permease subunit
VGQRRRVDVAVGLIGDPDLIFLDEPTTGFDPAARRDAWNMIEGLKSLGSGHFAYDVSFPGDTFGGFVVYLLLGTATMCILGIALTAILPTAETAATVAPFSAVLLSFISGVFIPVDQLPNWLEEIGRVFPLAHLAEGLQTTLAPGATGSGLSGENVGVLALWALVGLVVAVRRFRWEPQAARA